MTIPLNTLGRFRQQIATVLLGVFAVIGGMSAGQWVSRRFMASTLPDWANRIVDEKVSTISALPGPERRHDTRIYQLDSSNSVLMQGEDDPTEERWLDMAGNAYSRRFCSSFSYADPAKERPYVRLRIDPVGPTLKGRIEARGLKPGFAYQLKLNGVFEHRRAFEAIGSVGRWRLPGKETNYTDMDYQRAANKHLAEAYVLFDFLLTDAGGNVVRDFELTHSLHVLWNASRQRADARPEHVVPFWVDASSEERYVRPKRSPTLERIWAERERVRYSGRRDRIQLPKGVYQAEIVLTEESFHDPGNDGGWWATVMRAPVRFHVTEPGQ